MTLAALLLAWYFLVPPQGPAMLTTREGPFPDRATCVLRLTAMLPSLTPGPAPECYEVPRPKAIRG